MGWPSIYISSFLSQGFCLMMTDLISYQVLYLFLHVHHTNPGLIYWKHFHPRCRLAFSHVLFSSINHMCIRKDAEALATLQGCCREVRQCYCSIQRAEWSTKIVFPLTPWVQSEEFGTWGFTVVLCRTLGYNSSKGKCPENEDETDSNHLSKSWLYGFSISKER